MKNRVLMMVILLSSAVGVIAGEPGEGISIGKMVLRPYTDVSATHDSNPALVQTNVESDVFFEYILGTDLSFDGRNLDIYGNIFWYNRNYVDDVAATAGSGGSESLDSDGWGESLGLIWGTRDAIEFRANESYQRITDYSMQPGGSETFVSGGGQDSFLSESRGDRSERDLIDVSVAVGGEVTDKVEADLIGSYNDTDYVTDELFDLTESTLHGELAYWITDKSATFIVGEYTLQETDAFSGDPESIIARLGWKTRFTQKTIFKGSAGVEFYDDDSKVEGHDSTDTMPSFDLGWIWMPTAKLSFNTTGASNVEPSAYEAGNRRRIVVLRTAANYQFTPAFVGWTGISYRQDDYELTDAESDVSKKTDALGGRLGVEFAPPQKWYSLYATLSYEDSESTIDTETYDQFRATVGGKLIY